MSDVFRAPCASLVHPSCIHVFECALHRVDWCLVCLLCLEPEAETGNEVEHEFSNEVEHEVSNEFEHEDPSFDPNVFSSGKMTEPR